MVEVLPAVAVAALEVRSLVWQEEAEVRAVAEVVCRACLEEGEAGEAGVEVEGEVEEVLEALSLD